MIKNSKFKIQNSRKGFTLIELMVVMAIVGILAGISVVNFGRNPDRDVRLEKDRLVTFLRSVQNKALSGERPSENDVPACYDTTVTPHKFACNLCGYGIKLDSSGENIQVYYVTRADQNVACDPSSSGTDYAGNIFYPGNGVTISEMAAGDNIFFLIPHGDIYYNNGSLPKNIDLSKTVGSSTANVPVTITSGGIIK